MKTIIKIALMVSLGMSALSADTLADEKCKWEINNYSKNVELYNNGGRYVYITIALDSMIRAKYSCDKVLIEKIKENIEELKRIKK